MGIDITRKIFYNKYYPGSYNKKSGARKMRVANRKIERQL